MALCVVTSVNRHHNCKQCQQYLPCLCCQSCNVTSTAPTGCQRKGGTLFSMGIHRAAMGHIDHKGDTLSTNVMGGGAPPTTNSGLTTDCQHLMEHIPLTIPPSFLRWQKGATFRGRYGGEEHTPATSPIAQLIDKKYTKN